MSNSPIKSYRWFRNQPDLEEHGAFGAAVKTAIGVAVGGIALALGYRELAYLIWAIAIVIGVVTLGSATARTQVGRFFASLGRWIGWLLAVVLLTPVYLVVFSIIHLLGRLTGSDPLHLRDTDAPTFWLPSDQDRRKIRYIRSLFATEVATTRRGRGLMAVVCLTGALVAAEVVLRTLGFGNPVLYLHDARAGFYPGPNQSSDRYGGHIEINEYGMRAPDFETDKDPGTLRVLMLGDSTLWGGSYVDQQDIYARRVARSLEEQFPERKIEVLNMGVNGWGPFHELGYVEQFGTFDADLAIVCLPIGDIYRPLSYLTGLPYFTVDQPPRLALEEVARHLNWRTRQWGKQRDLKARQAQGDIGIEAYVQLGERLREDGCEVMFEILPGSVAGTTDQIPEYEERAVHALRSRLEAAGFAVGYPAALFADQGESDELYHDLVHLDTLGHQIYAEYLEGRLRDDCAKFRDWVSPSDLASDGNAEEKDQSP